MWLGVTRSTMRGAKKLRLWIAITALVFVFAHVHSPPIRAQNHFGSLNEFGNSFESDTPYSVSPDGDWIVGKGVSPTTWCGAFLWSESSGLTYIGDLFGGDTCSVAYGVSDSSARIVVGQGESLNGSEAFWYFHPIVMVGLGDLPGGEFYSVAHGVSANGQVIVGTSDSGNREAFRWTTQTGMVGLGTLPGDSLSLGKAVSHDGSTIVGISKKNSTNRAFRWSYATGMVEIGTDMSAHNVSADGSVVVGKGKSPGGETAFRWTEATGVEWIVPEFGHTAAHAVSADGSIILGNLNAGAFIWDPQQGARNIEDVLMDDFGFSMFGWFLESANAISADGLTIAGRGKRFGEPQAWRAKVDAAWISGAGGSWDDRSNWAFGIEPNEMHELLINPTANLAVIGPSAPTNVAVLTVGAGTGIAGLVVQPAGDISATNGLLCAANGKLQGTGTFNADATLLGTLAPSLSPSHTGEIRFVGDVTCLNSSVEIDVHGDALSDFDRITIIGRLKLDGNLSVYVDPNFTPGPKAEFLIVDVTGQAWGQFDGLAEGQLVGNFNGTDLFITYLAGDGNDIALVAQP